MGECTECCIISPPHTPCRRQGPRAKGSRGLAAKSPSRRARPPTAAAQGRMPAFFLVAGAASQPEGPPFITSSFPRLRPQPVGPVVVTPCFATAYSHPVPPTCPVLPAGPVHARFSRLHPIFVKFGIYGSPLSPLKTSHVWRHVSTVGEELFVSLHGYTAAETSVKAFGRHDGDDPPVNLDQYAVHSAEPCPGEESYLVLDFGCLSLQGGRFSDLSTWGSF